MGQIWDKYQPALDLADFAADALRVFVLYVAPAGWATFEVVAYLARTDHLAVAWLTIVVVALVGVAIARTATQPTRPAWTGRRWNQLRAALPATAAVDKVRWFVRDMTIALVVMWATCVALLWALEDTSLLAVASRHMPVNPDGIGREALTAGGTTQILSTLTVSLPALLILLVAAGALHRPARGTEG
jgi:hypothetical protein